MTMRENYKIIGKYIKDMSSETPDAETYIFVKDYISNYQLNIDINSKALKDKMIEINTIMKFEDKQNNKKKSHFEINYATIIRVGENIKEKKDLEKIILCDVQIEIYPQLEKALLDLLHNSGYQDIKFEKKGVYMIFGLFKSKQIQFLEAVVDKNTTKVKRLIGYSEVDVNFKNDEKWYDSGSTHAKNAFCAGNLISGRGEGFGTGPGALKRPKKIWVLAR